MHEQHEANIALLYSWTRGRFKPPEGGSDPEGVKSTTGEIVQQKEELWRCDWQRQPEIAKSDEDCKRLKHRAETELELLESRMCYWSGGRQQARRSMRQRAKGCPIRGWA